MSEHPASPGDNCTVTSQTVSYESVVFNFICQFFQRAVKGYKILSSFRYSASMPDRLFFAFGCIAWMQFATWFLVKGPRRTHNNKGSSDILLSEFGPLVIFVGAGISFLVYLYLLCATTGSWSLIDICALGGIITSCMASTDLVSDCWVKDRDGELRRVVFMQPARMRYAYETLEAEQAHEEHREEWEEFWFGPRVKVNKVKEDA